MIRDKINYKYSGWELRICKTVSFDADIFKINFLSNFRCITDLVYLQCNKSFCIECVHQISNGCSVYPCFYFITDTFNFVMIEFMYFKSTLCNSIERERIEPSPPAFIINATRSEERRVGKE